MMNLIDEEGRIIRMANTVLKFFLKIPVNLYSVNPAVFYIQVPLLKKVLK